MKPTSDDFAPRRDGWYEHRGTWEEVTVGTVIASSKRTQRWEIIEQAHGAQVEFGRTLWMRAREQTTGEEFTAPPRQKWAAVTILTQDPSDTKTPELTEPSDTEAILLLIKELGAETLATRDEATKEITCPDYASGKNHLDEIGGGSLGRGEREHLSFAHGIDTSDIEAMEWEPRMHETTRIHGLAHNPKHPEVGKGGFPHRHAPEDLTLFRP